MHRHTTSSVTSNRFYNCSKNESAECTGADFPVQSRWPKSFLHPLLYKMSNVCRTIFKGRFCFGYFLYLVDNQASSCAGAHEETLPRPMGPQSPKLTDEFVLLDEAAELPTGNQLTPLSQDQLRREDNMANENIQTQSTLVGNLYQLKRLFGQNGACSSHKSCENSLVNFK